METSDRKRIVLNTRSMEQQDALSLPFEAAGFSVAPFPSISVKLVLGGNAWGTAVPHLYDKTLSWIVFTSAHAVASLAANIKKMQEESSICIDGTPLPSIACIGATTADAVREYLGVDPVYVSQTATGAYLAAHLPLSDYDRILLPQSNIARPETAQILSQRRAVVIEIVAYKTVIGRGGVEAHRMISHGEIDLLSFTSPSTVTGFMARLAQEGLTVKDIRHIPAVCIGPTTFEAALKFNLNLIPHSAEHTVLGMAESASSYFDTLDTPIRKTTILNS